MKCQPFFHQKLCVRAGINVALVVRRKLGFSFSRNISLFLTTGPVASGLNVRRSELKSNKSVTNHKTVSFNRLYSVKFKFFD